MWFIPTRSQVQILSPPYGTVAQLVEHLFCTQKVAGSNPASSTAHRTKVPSPLFSEDGICVSGTSPNVWVLLCKQRL